MKKIIAGVTAVVIWFAVVITYTVIATRADADEDAHEFTVLTVKEETVKDYNNMPVFKDLARVTGRDVYWTYNTSTQYSNNTDPVGTKGIDAIYHTGFSNLQLYNYGRSGRIVAIDNYLKNDKVMPNLYKILNGYTNENGEEVAGRSDILEALKSPDGHIYSLPRVEEMGLKAHPNILFINKKWVEKLIDENNLPAEVNLTKDDLADGLQLKRSEFKAILQKFKDCDMDGDGSTADEVPLSFVNGNWQGNISDLVASFGVPENREHKTIVDDKITFTIESENWFNAVKELNDWYNKGLISASAFDNTAGQDDFLAKGQDGRYGAFYWWEKETVVKKDLQDDYVMLKALTDDDGKTYVGLSNELEIEKGECVILSSCKDISGLLSYFDKFFEPKYSAQLNYGSIESNAFEKPKSDDDMLKFVTDHGAQSADDFRMKNAPYGVVYLTDEVWNKKVQMEPRAQTRLDRLAVYLEDNSFKNLKSIPNLNYEKDELDTLNRYENSLGKNINNWFTTRIIAGSAPTVSDWQSFLKTNATSIEQVTKINQKAYDRYLEKTAK